MTEYGAGTKGAMNGPSSGFELTILIGGRDTVDEFRKPSESSLKKGRSLSI
jgi:hypothetical protein